jgi:hypothetical protein
MAGQDPGLIKDAVMGEVRKHFRPEFVNRIDEIVVFQALDAKQIRAIAKIQLQRLEQRLAAQDMRLEVSDAALAEIAKVGFDPLYGARPLKRAIQQEIENPVAKLVLEGRFGPSADYARLKGARFAQVCAWLTSVPASAVFALVVGLAVRVHLRDEIHEHARGPAEREEPRDRDHRCQQPPVPRQVPLAVAQRGVGARDVVKGVAQ